MVRSGQEAAVSLTLVLLIYFYIHIMQIGVNTPGLSWVPGHLRTKFQRLYPCFRGRAVE